ncbi:MAG TPA: hypothetical protein VHF23_08020 [Gaiellaceae bacterium]|nr:hypothetical protein [Gaiellaceae bacterium]
MPPAARALLVLCAFAAAGCGVGGGGSDGRGEVQRVTPADLALMVLPRAELGAAARGLRPDEDSGPTSNASAADETLDPDDTRVSLRGAGRVAGHKLYYAQPNVAAAALRGKKGVYVVGTEVELLRDPVYAAQHLNKQLDDLHRLQGTAVDGVRLTRVSDFEALGVGDEASGIRAVSSFAGLKMHMTIVAFRRGRLVGAAAISRGDRRDVSEEARALAAALDERIQGVLAGEIEGKPAPVDPPAAKRASFAGRERLPSLTLALEDLPAGARSDGEGRRKRESYVSFHRSFEDVRLGGSHLLALRAETQLHRTPAEAALAYRLLGRPEGRRAFARAMLDRFAEDAVVEPWNVRVRPFPGRRVNGVVVSFEVPEGRFEVAAVFLRSNRVIQSVSGFCTAAALDPADLRPLAGRARARLGDAV